MNIIIIQIIGAIAYALLAHSFYKKKKIDILFIQIFAYIGFAIHYYLLSGVTGAICNLISLVLIVIIYIFEKYELKNIKLLIIFEAIILVVIANFSYENIYSIFPIIGSVITLITFISKSENKIRIAGIFSAICWFIYAIIYKSYVAIVFESLLVISTIIAYLKNRNNLIKTEES